MSGGGSGLPFSLGARRLGADSGPDPTGNLFPQTALAMGGSLGETVVKVVVFLSLSLSLSLSLILYKV